MEANKEQLQAINSNDRTILCLAGAGAGKTYCLVNRMKRLAESGTNPKRILALTFTNAAAHEMLERFHKISKTAAPEVRTFHGFCYSLIVKDVEVRRAVGYSTIPNIATDAEIKEIKTRVNELLPNKVPKDVLEGKRAPTAKELVFLEMFNKRFAKEMKLANLITFDYMCEEVCKLFKEKKAVVHKYFDYYKHILVDEFQDTDKTQFEFVSSFPETTSMFLVGDAYQCIYQFRNCTNEYVKLLSAAPGWTVIKLPNNYRSTKQICQYANKFSCRYGSTEYRVEMIGHKDGPEVCLRTEDVGWEGYSDANTVRYILSKLPEMEGTTAILVRSNKEVAEYTQLLRSDGIELGSSAKDDTVDLLKCINDDEYFLEYVVSSCLDANQYSTYMKMTLADSAPMTISTLENLFKEARKMKSTIKKVTECRRAFALLSIPEAVAKIEGILKTKFNVNKEVVPDDKKLAVEYLIEASIKKVESLVYVGTIHSAKGLEYDNVFIPGVGSKSFKLDSEEQKNIFYVGITRAKTNLTVFIN